METKTEEVVIPKWITDAQAQSMEVLARRNPRLTLRMIVDSATPMFGGDGAIVVWYGSIWVAIEADGYRHS